MQRLTYPPERHIASDSDYSLFSVVIFKRIHDEFVQKCRENKYVQIAISLHISDNTPARFIVRDFVYSEEQIAKQEEELEIADSTEKELWVRTASCDIRPSSSTPFTD